MPRLNWPPSAQNKPASSLTRSNNGRHLTECNQIYAETAHIKRSFWESRGPLTGQSSAARLIPVSVTIARLLDYNRSLFCLPRPRPGTLFSFVVDKKWKQNIIIARGWLPRSPRRDYFWDIGGVYACAWGQTHPHLLHNPCIIDSRWGAVVRMVYTERNVGGCG